MLRIINVIVIANGQNGVPGPAQNAAYNSVNDHNAELPVMTYSIAGTHAGAYNMATTIASMISVSGSAMKRLTIVRTCRRSGSSHSGSVSGIVRIVVVWQ